MRITVEFEVTGDTLSDIVDAANETWKEFTEEDQNLSTDTEMFVEPNQSTNYKAVVITRMKVSND